MSKKFPNILFFGIDSLRRDRMSLYGYPKLTTPHIDAFLAEDSIVFDNMFSPSIPTTPGYASMLSGKDCFGTNVVAHIAGHDFGISQITCVDSDRQLKRKDQFLELMAKTKAEHGYSMMVLMLTDVLLEGSKILCLGGEDTFRQAFNVEVKDHEAFLPRVMSRKKQMVPMLSALWG